VHIVSVINYKGGAGKTTLTANLGAELATRGKSVLLLDFDAQSGALKERRRA
jgi:chromosome partitioning protein